MARWQFSVIFGARTVGQLEDNLAAAEVKLGAKHMARLDAASAFDLGNLYQFLSNVQKLGADVRLIPGAKHFNAAQEPAVLDALLALADG